MKRKILIGTIVALTGLTTANAWAAAAEPLKISGEVKSKYEYNEKQQSKFKNEVKINMNTKADKMTTVDLEVKYSSKVNNTTNEETNEIKLENAWMELSLNPRTNLRLGSQPLEIGKKLWLDADGVSGAKLSFDSDKNNSFCIFSGRDSQDDDTPTITTQLLNYTHNFSKGSIGAYTGHQGDDRYVGGYGKYELLPNLKIEGEYLKNNHNNTKAYVSELAYGDTKKVGSMKISATYLHADKDVFLNNDYTGYDDEYTSKYGFRGSGAKVAYKLSSATTLEVEKWWGKKMTNDQTWINSSVELKVAF